MGNVEKQRTCPKGAEEQRVMGVREYRREEEEGDETKPKARR